MDSKVARNNAGLLSFSMCFVLSWFSCFPTIAPWARAPLHGGEGGLAKGGEVVSVGELKGYVRYRAGRVLAKVGVIWKNAGRLVGVSEND